MGITNNAINNTSQTLAIGTGTPNDTHYILYAKKDQADASILRIENLNSQGRSAVIANCNSTNGANQASIGFYQYGSNYSDQFAAANTSVIFSNAYSAGMTLACNFGKLLMIDANDVTNVSLTTTGGQYKGNNTNTVSPAGFIGEVISGTATGVTQTKDTFVNISSVTLTAGNWLIFGRVRWDTTGSVATSIYFDCDLSATTASGTPISTHVYDTDYWSIDNLGPTSGLDGLAASLGPYPVSIASNTTYYLNSRGGATTFTSVTSAGTIRAVRVG